jgi:hypothetical protein
LIETDVWFTNKKIEHLGDLGQHFSLYHIHLWLERYFQQYAEVYPTSYSLHEETLQEAIQKRQAEIASQVVDEEGTVVVEAQPAQDSLYLLLVYLEKIIYHYLSQTEVS